MNSTPQKQASRKISMPREYAGHNRSSSGRSRTRAPSRSHRLPSTTAASGAGRPRVRTATAATPGTALPPRRRRSPTPRCPKSRATGSDLIRIIEQLARHPPAEQLGDQIEDRDVRKGDRRRGIPGADSGGDVFSCLGSPQLPPVRDAAGTRAASPPPPPRA